MEFLDLAKMLTELGTLAGLVVFFVWRASKRETAHQQVIQEERESAVQREARLGDRITKLEEFQRNTLMEMVHQSTLAITQCTTVMARLEQFLEEGTGVDRNSNSA